jgi:uncharacterized membrane-anchored protein
MKRQERGVLLAGAGFHVMVLAAMIALHYRVLLLGEPILLRVTPVDPRDIFRGDYVILSYEFSRVPLSGIQGLPQSGPNQWSPDHEGRAVYVSLVPDPDGRHWRANGVSVVRPSDGRYIQGKIGKWGGLEFGIEAYFVQEGKGREYERAVRERRLSAEIALTSDGQAKLRGLRIE